MREPRVEVRDVGLERAHARHGLRPLVGAERLVAVTFGDGEALGALVAGTASHERLVGEKLVELIQCAFEAGPVGGRSCALVEEHLFGDRLVQVFGRHR